MQIIVTFERTISWDILWAQTIPWKKFKVTKWRQLIYLETHKFHHSLNLALDIKVTKKLSRPDNCPSPFPYLQQSYCLHRHCLWDEIPSQSAGYMCILFIISKNDVRTLSKDKAITINQEQFPRTRRNMKSSSGFRSHLQTKQCTGCHCVYKSNSGCGVLD